MGRENQTEAVRGLRWHRSTACTGAALALQLTAPFTPAAVWLLPPWRQQHNSSSLMDVGLSEGNSPLFFFFFFLRDSPHFSISQGYERSPRWADIPTCHPLKKCISSYRCFHHLWFWGCYISSAYWQSLLERSQNLPHEFPQTTLKRQAGMKGEERKLLLESEPLNCAGWTARSLQNRSSWKKKTSTQSTECCLQYFCAMKCCSQIPWSWEDDAMCTSASAHHFTERH